jgi:phage-related protein
MAAEILTALGFQMDQAGLKALERGTRRLVTNVTNAAEGVVRINDSMARALNFAKSIVAGYLTVRTFRMVTSDVSMSVSELDKWNTAIGVSHDRLQEFAHVGRQTGLELEDVGDVMKELAVKANDAFGIAQSKDARELFKQMGIGKEQIVGVNNELKSTDEMLLVVADAFSKMTNRAKAGAAIDDLLSDAGVRAAKLFALGRKGIEQLAKEARESGLIMDKRTLQAARLYAKQKRQIMSLLIGFRNILAGKVLPPLTRFIKSMMSWWREGDNAERVTRNLIRAGAALGLVLGHMVRLWAVGKLKAFGQALLAAAASMRNFGSSALAAQLKSALIIAAVTALVVAMVDLYETMQGKETITTRLIGDPDKVDALRQVLRGIVRFFSEIWEEARPVAIEFLKVFGAAVWSLFKTLGPIVFDVGKALLQIITAVAPLYAALFKTMISVWAALWKALKPLVPALATILRIFITIMSIPIRIMALKLTVIAKILGAIVQLVLAVAKATKFIWKPILDAVLWALNLISRVLNRISALVELAFKDPVEAARQAWEDLAEFFSSFWEKFNEVAEDAILWIIRNLRKIPDGFKAAWDAAMAGIRAAVRAVVGVIMSAVNALRALTGQQQVAGTVGKGRSAALAAAQKVVGDEAQIFRILAKPQLAVPGAEPGLELGRRIARVAPLEGMRGPPSTIDNRQTNNFSLGSVTVVANAQDARQVGKTVEEVLDQKINKIVTGAARDLRKAKGGQK